MDIVKFIEKLYHINLMEYQKQLVRNIYHALENGEEIKWLVPPRGGSRFDLSILHGIVCAIYKEQMKGDATKCGIKE